MNYTVLYVHPEEGEKYTALDRRAKQCNHHFVWKSGRGRKRRHHSIRKLLRTGQEHLQVCWGNTRDARTLYFAVWHMIRCKCAVLFLGLLLHYTNV